MVCYKTPTPFIVSDFLIQTFEVLHISHALNTRYRHLGSFAPLGGEQAAAELPGDWVSVGHSTQWLWYSIYAR